MKWLDQHEMLMDHADAVAIASPRRADADRLAVDADLAGVGVVEAVEDRHQRRLAGAVLADDAVDDAALDDEIDVLVGVDRAEALVDADQLDRGGGSGLGRHAHLRVAGPSSEAAALRAGRGAGDDSPYIGHLLSDM